MKEKKLYTCEICNTDYATKLAATQCEKNHKCGLEIVDTRYLNLSQDKSGMPISITVKSKDGTTKIYKRC